MLVHLPHKDLPMILPHRRSRLITPAPMWNAYIIIFGAPPRIKSLSATTCVQHTGDKQFNDHKLVISAYAYAVALILLLHGGALQCACQDSQAAQVVRFSSVGFSLLLLTWCLPTTGSCDGSGRQAPPHALPRRQGS